MDSEDQSLLVPTDPAAEVDSTPNPVDKLHIGHDLAIVTHILCMQKVLETERRYSQRLWEESSRVESLAPHPQSPLSNEDRPEEPEPDIVASDPSPSRRNLSKFMTLEPRPARCANAALALEQCAFAMQMVEDGHLRATGYVANPAEDLIFKHFLCSKTKTTSLSAEAALLGSTEYVVRRLRTLSAFAAVTMQARDSMRLIKGDEAQFRVTVADREICAATTATGRAGALAKVTNASRFSCKS